MSAARIWALAALVALGSAVVVRGNGRRAAGSRAGPCHQPRLVEAQLVCGEVSEAAARAVCPGRELPPPGSVIDAQCRWRAGASLMRALAVPVDLNRGSPEALQSLPGVGPVLARRIMAARPLRDVRALLDVKGIGPVTLRRIRSRVQVVAHPP